MSTCLDHTDLKLIRVLLADSRTSYRELAERLGISVPSVHTRIQMLVQKGVIAAFKTRLSLGYLGAPTVILSGFSQAPDPTKLYEPLEREGRTFWIAVAAGNFLYIGGYLHNLGELDDYTTFVTREAKLLHPLLGIAPPPPLPLRRGRPVRLDRLDYRILRALAKDARRPVTEVAKEVGVSAKTAARRLETMTRSEALQFTLEWFPNADGVLPLYHVILKPGEDKQKAIATLMNRYGNDLLGIDVFSNVPDRLYAVSWTTRTMGVDELQARLQGEPAIESVTTFVIYAGRWFDSWRDRIVAERAASKVPLE